jgi:hypothetical protein
MRIFPSIDSGFTNDGSYIFLDTNFIKALFDEEGLLEFSLKFFDGATFIIHPLVKFEFLRDIYIPEQKEIKEKFVSQEVVFFPEETNNEIARKAENRAMILSSIYRHQKDKYKNDPKPSYVDLTLASRVGDNPKKYFILTQNKKDFPICIFDVLATIMVEKDSGEVPTYFLLKFNEQKFATCVEEMKKLSKELTE